MKTNIASRRQPLARGYLKFTNKLTMNTQFPLRSRLTPSLTMLAALCFGPIGFTAHAQTPTHQYRLNETGITAGTTAVDSAGSVNGTYRGNVTSTTVATPSGDNSAAHFTGTAGTSGDGVGLTGNNVSLLGGLTNFTITAFFQIDADYASAIRFLYDESQSLDGPKRPTLLLRLDAGGAAQFGINSNDGSGFHIATANTITLATSTWYLLGATLNASSGLDVFLFDAATRNLLASGHDTFAKAATTTDNATIGSWTGAQGSVGQNDPFLGLISDFRTYNTSLTQQQIAAVPEPATWITMLVGLGICGYVQRFRRT